MTESQRKTMDSFFGKGKWTFISEGDTDIQFILEGDPGNEYLVKKTDLKIKRSAGYDVIA